MKIFNRLILLSLFFITSCKTQFVATSNDKQLYKVSANGQTDTISEIENYLKPFRDSLNITMNEVIGEAMGDFIKEKPSGSLGNLVVDAMLYEARNSMFDVRRKDTIENLTSKIENRIVSGAITNPGGLRINQIPKGEITKGKIFELLPFENELVIVEVNGKILKQWMELIKEKEGWPMTPYNFSSFVDNGFRKLGNDTIVTVNPSSEEIEYKVIEGKNIYFYEDSTYYIATNDYVANGGDKCDFLIPCIKYPTGKTIRELVIEFIKNRKRIIPNRTNETFCTGG